MTGDAVLDGHLASPLAIVRRDPLQHNISVMQSWCDERGVALAPHAKTTMTPSILRAQLAAGAWGLTVANAAQAAVAVRAGARALIVANEVSDPAGVAVLAGLVAADPELRLLCYVDSVAGAQLLDALLQRAVGADDVAPQRLEVLLELGMDGMRAGLRDDEDATAVASAVAASSTLRLVGVAGFEGLVAPGDGSGSGSGGASGAEAVGAFCRRIVDVAGRLVDAGLLESSAARPAILSAGGSTYFDTVTKVLRDNAIGAQVVVRSGCYVTHDHGLYERTTPLARVGDGPALQPALEVCARVLSRPEPTRVIVDAGRRDLSYDAGLPVPLWARSVDGTGPRGLTASVTALSDQHAWLDLAADERLAVGEWVGLGISHPCTTFDKWRTLYLVDEDDRVVEALTSEF